MKKTLNLLKSRETLYISIIAVLFICFSYIGQAFSEELRTIIAASGKWSMLVYTAFLTFEVVFAPVSVLPIIPLAVSLFGSFNAAVLSIIGWAIGSQLAFIIARLWGKKLLARFMDLNKVEKISASIDQKNMFLSLIMLRISFPVDLLSYAVGMFTNMHWFSYLIASIIGVAPFAFLYAYAAIMPIQYQIIGGVLALLALVAGYKKIKRNVKKNETYASGK